MKEVRRGGRLGGAFLALCLLLALPGPSSAAEEALPADLVLLLDASQSVLPYFGEVTELLVGPLLRDYLRRGDYFHLLSFGEEPRLELARRVEDEEDLRAALAALYLVAPLAPRTDLLAALRRLSDYLSGLPPARPKAVVIVTDGLHDPAGGLPAGASGAASFSREIAGAAAAFRGKGWTVRIVRLPFGPEGGPAGSPAGSASALPAEGASALPAERGASLSEGRAPGGSAPPAAGSAPPLGTALPPSAPAGSLPGTPTPPGLPRPRTAGTPSGAPPSAEAPSGAAPSAGAPEEAAAAGGAPAAGGPAAVGPGQGPSPDLLEEAAEALGAELSDFPPESGGETALGRLDLPPPGRARLLPSWLPLAGLGLLGLAILALAIGLARRALSARAKAPLIRAVGGHRPPPGRAAPPRGTQAAARPPAAPAQAATPASASPTASRPAALAPARAATTASAYPTASRPAAPAPARAAPPSRPSTLTAPSGPQPEAYSYQSRVLAPGSLRVELRVSGQNPHIGERNIHLLHAGAQKSVGGGRSDYLVFLLPVPRGLGELHFDGRACAFVPRRPELFPELQGPLEDCLEKEIVLLGPRGRRLVLRFQRYEPPAQRINRLLHCIEAPGLFLP